MKVKPPTLLDADDICSLTSAIVATGASSTILGIVTAGTSGTSWRFGAGAATFGAFAAVSTRSTRLHVQGGGGRGGRGTVICLSRCSPTVCEAGGEPPFLVVFIDHAREKPGAVRLFRSKMGRRYAPPCCDQDSLSTRIVHPTGGKTRSPSKLSGSTIITSFRRARTTAFCLFRCLLSIPECKVSLKL